MKKVFYDVVQNIATAIRKVFVKEIAQKEAEKVIEKVKKEDTSTSDEDTGSDGSESFQLMREHICNECTRHYSEQLWAQGQFRSAPGKLQMDTATMFRSRIDAIIEDKKIKTPEQTMAAMKDAYEKTLNEFLAEYNRMAKKERDEEKRKKELREKMEREPEHEVPAMDCREEDEWER